MNKKFSLLLFCVSIFLGENNIFANNAKALTDSIIRINTLFNDNFDQGNLSLWTDTVAWEIVDNNLKHSATTNTEAGKSFVCSRISAHPFCNNPVEWSFTIKTNHDATTSNFFEYWLMAENDTLLSKTQNGYYVTNKNKTIELYRADKGKNTSLIKFGTWSKDNATNIYVCRQTSGLWNIGVIDGNDTTLCATPITDNTYQNLPFHGLTFTFSKTRIGGIELHNTCIKSLITKTKATEIIGYNSCYIDIFFSDMLDKQTAIDKKNYSLDNGTIINATYSATAPYKVTLTTSLLHDGNNTLTINGLKNSSGDIIDIQSLSFSYQTPATPYSIVFNEIMFDPSPSVDLPEYDYLELYNRTNNDISLNGWILDVGGVQKTFPDSIIKSNNFVIITSSAALGLYAEYGTTINGITTTSLTNTGKTLKLISPEGVTIDSITYSATSITDPAKNDGGWSFERIDPNNTCGGFKNWAYSISQHGGTPGSINSVNAPNIDNSPFKVNYVSAINENQICIALSKEPKTQGNALLNCFIVNNIGAPISAIVTDSLVTITFEQKLNLQTQYKITVSGIVDYCDNVLADTVAEFMLYQPNLYDLVITEIYATPTDNGVLPNHEWFEIYNRSNFDINLTNFIVKIGNKEHIINNGIIKQNSYALIASNSSVGSLIQFGNVIGVNKLSAMPLSSTITILTPSGTPICQTAYQQKWFTDDIKATGGYSLERIDNNNPNETNSNWAQSEATKGATPCQSNSITAPNNDTQLPQLQLVFPTSDSTILLVFNKAMNAENATNCFTIEPLIGQPKTAKIQSSSLCIVELGLASTLDENTTYTLTVDQMLHDVSGYSIDNCSRIFGLPQKAEIGDIIISEILFNPYPNGYDFVELYNNSDKTIDIANFIIASRDSLGNIKTPKHIGGIGFVLMPNSHVAITTNAENLAQTYNCGDIYQVSSLPSMPDDKGNVVLLDTAINLFDEVSYTSKMHFALLKDLNGVSLERIDYQQPASNQNNWHSASELVGWATPGLKNSVCKTIDTESDDFITLNTEVFSPDNDGYNDQIEIIYNLDEAGYVANVTIFNSRGVKVRQLVSNELLGTSGFWAWDGIDDKNNAAPIGIYVIHCEIFDLNGKAKHVQKACVVSKKL